MKISTLLILIFFGIHNLAKPQVMLEQTVVDTSTVIYGLDIPWELQWGPDDRLWVTERFGRVSRIDPQTGTQDVILDISGQVYAAGEAGLLGMALHPDFANHPWVYLAYTYLQGTLKREKVVRYEYNGTSLQNEFILIDSIRAATTHNGCRLIITPDNKLFFTTGDAQVTAAAQDTNDLSGKIHRINLDGTIPADNPWPGNPAYSIGHRNAQGLYYASNGILYSSEHGPSTDDEINIIEPARNYGWPNVKGYCDQPGEMTFCQEYNVAEPITAWTPTIATSDIVYYDHPSIPEWQGNILLTTLKNKRIYALELDGSGTAVVDEKQYFNDFWGRLRDICIGPDGAIYLATNGASWSNTNPFTHRIVKIWNAAYVPVIEIELDLTVNLEGPFTDPEMSAALYAAGQLPLVQPYGGSPWFYTGTEAVQAIPNGEVVDWILLEFRDTTQADLATSATTVAMQAAFLLKDGSIVGLDGSSNPTATFSIQDSLFVVVRHRNHLAVMSSGPLVENNGIWSWDFSTGPEKVHLGNLGYKELAAGTWGMAAADGNTSGSVDNTDKINIWNQQAGLTGYLEGDFNLDEQVNSQDKNDLWNPNSGMGSQVPE